MSVAATSVLVHNYYYSIRKKPSKRYILTLSALSELIEKLAHNCEPLSYLVFAEKQEYSLLL